MSKVLIDPVLIGTVDMVRKNGIDIELTIGIKGVDFLTIDGFEQEIASKILNKEVVIGKSDNKSKWEL